jgi:hypothetical protein
VEAQLIAQQLENVGADAINVKVGKITPRGLVCEKDGMEFKLHADTVVISSAMRSRNDIKGDLGDRGIEFHRIGSVAKVGNAPLAFRSGYEVVDDI